MSYENRKRENKIRPIDITFLVWRAGITKASAEPWWGIMGILGTGVFLSYVVFPLSVALALHVWLLHPN